MGISCLKAQHGFPSRSLSTAISSMVIDFARDIIGRIVAGVGIMRSINMTTT